MLIYTQHKAIYIQELKYKFLDFLAKYIKGEGACLKVNIVFKIYISLVTLLFPLR